MTEDQAHDPARLNHLAADTTAARAVLVRCAGRKLLPDQEGIYDTTVRLLGETQAAIESGDLPRAESLARRARRIATSLNCP